MGPLKCEHCAGPAGYGIALPEEAVLCEGCASVYYATTDWNEYIDMITEHGGEG